ncbi:protein phosphatase 4 regulatory subunit 3 protein [Dioscorea alata]|uniref:Protein phosphatase 4 regulatory subunit 3 protein n=1 Tax=Dioscorea alata TaxID=55571 RepID=A0ACB7V0A1_DIOAL|nr:protein phosphatase 4 regulatory subunit 3 protein [Dioscorea alata]
MGEQGKANGSINSMQRVKVYQLKNDGKWDDKGTGHVSVDYLERSEDLGLIVIDEEDHNTLISHRISSDEIYRKQEDTIISWRDPELSAEVALSFQEPTGCSYIWDHICGVQRNLHFNTLSNLEVGPRPTMESFDSVGRSHSNDESFHAVNSELQELPSVELSTLPLILKTLLECGVTDPLRVADLILQDLEFFPKLVDLFRMCEDSENMDGLHMIFRLVKAIILLNSPQIFDRIFGDEFILDIIGSLEYDPDIPQVQNHRSFLKEHVIFKEAIPIKDPLVLSKIHQTYRIGYIKDVILPRVLDEATIASLSAIIQANNATVVLLLKDDTSFIQELFARMKSPSISDESKRNLVLFFHEFCALSKSLALGQQMRLFRYQTLLVKVYLTSLQVCCRARIGSLCQLDLLLLFLNQDPNLLRSYVIQPEGNVLLGLLVKGLVTDFGEDMHCQFLEIVRILLDSHTLSGSQSFQRDTIIDIFYEKHLDQLIDVITSSCPSTNISHKSSKSASSSRRLNARGVTKPEILLNICELLCFCVLHHPYRIKCNFLMNNVIEKVLLLTRRREKFLVVAAIRFMRAIVSRNDDHLFRHIVKNNLLKPIIDGFIGNGSRYNMLHSGVLELLEYIRKENIKILILYVVDTFWGQLMRFEHLGSIQGLRVKYEQSLESCDIKNGPNVTDPRKRIDERALEKEEEDYFNEDSDEEDSATAHSSRTWDQRTRPSLPNGNKANYSSLRPSSGGLVDYEDDDDEDDDYNPPPRKPEASGVDDRESTKSKRKLTSKADCEDRTFEIGKKRRLDQNLSDSNNVSPPAGSLCTDIDFPNNAQLCDATLTTENNDRLHENRGDDEESPSSQNCNESHPEAADVRQSSSDDCPLAAPINNSSPDMVVNGASSEPYSVR